MSKSEAFKKTEVILQVEMGHMHNFQFNLFLKMHRNKQSRRAILYGLVGFVIVGICYSGCH
jgi:hypothetical protein